MTGAKEQVSGLPHAMRYKKVSGGDGYSDMMAVRPDGRWIRAQDYDAALDMIAVKQAEIDRLREEYATLEHQWRTVCQIAAMEIREENERETQGDAK